MRHIGVTVFIVQSLLSCTAPAEPVEQALSELGAIDVRPQVSEEYGNRCSRVYQRAEKIVGRISSVPALKTLAYRCYQRGLESRPTQENLTDPCPFFDGLSAVVKRLASIQTDEAARVLVELYRDQSFGWDAGRSLMTAHAISMCGTPCLPYLEQWRREEGDAAVNPELIRCIQAGELYGP